MFKVLGILTFAFAINACGISPSEQSQLQVRIEEINYSVWDAVYADDFGKFVVRNTLYINGNQGHYVTQSGHTGYLTGLVYAYITPEPNPKAAIYGTWSMNGQSGGFTFRIQEDGQTMIGQWAGANNARGSWNGYRK